MCFCEHDSEPCDPIKAGNDLTLGEYLIFQERASTTKLVTEGV
jgi:hypothetical protein